MEIEVTVTKKITRCYHECPYFMLDGGPGPVMMCTHPDIGPSMEDCYIISHPQCDNGFPDKCPLLRRQNDR